MPTRLQSVPPRDLSDTRLQLHWAAQPVAAAGGAHVTARPDDSHRNLGFDPETETLLGHASATTPAFRAGISIRDLSLVFRTGESEERFAFPGHTLDDGYAWLEERIRSATGAGDALPRPEYDMPEHAAADGGSFQPDPAHLGALAGWYGLAHASLTVIAAGAAASEVRCWPHHFDLATLITVEEGADAETSRTVGLGLSPGDAGIPEPYFYVTPWPYPESPEVGALPAGGEWNLDGWVGAVLRGSALLEAAGDGSPESLLRDFLGEARRQAEGLIRTR